MGIEEKLDRIIEILERGVALKERQMNGSSPSSDGSHEHSMRCFRETDYCPNEVKRHGGRESGDEMHGASPDGNTARSRGPGDRERLSGSAVGIAAAYPAMPQTCCGHDLEPPKAESAAAQLEGGLCTLCNDGAWKGEAHFKRSEKHRKDERLCYLCGAFTTWEKPVDGVLRRICKKCSDGR